MRILVTGATGFIGSVLSRRCAEAGHEIIGFGHTNNDWEALRATELQGAGIKVVIGSVLDTALVRSTCENVDAIVHLAAAQHESKVGIDYFRKINVDGSRILLDAAGSAGVSRFVFGSTIGVYGSRSNGLALDENSPPRPDNHYAVSKLEAEQVVRDHADRLSVTIARISETYGPGDMRLLKLFRGVQKGWFPMIGSCQNKHQPVYVDDLAVALQALATGGGESGNTVILAGPKAISTMDMIHAVEKALEARIHNLHVPLRPLSGMAMVLEKILPPLHITPPFTRRRLDFFRSSFWFDTTRAFALLGFLPQVDFDAGARKTAEWYREKGLLPQKLLSQ